MTESEMNRDIRNAAVNVYVYEMPVSSPCVCGGTEQHYEAMIDGEVVEVFWSCEQCGRSETYWYIGDEEDRSENE